MNAHTLTLLTLYWRTNINLQSSIFFLSFFRSALHFYFILKKEKTLFSTGPATKLLVSRWRLRTREYRPLDRGEKRKSRNFLIRVGTTQVSRCRLFFLVPSDLDGLTMVSSDEWSPRRVSPRDCCCCCCHCDDLYNVMFDPLALPLLFFFFSYHLLVVPCMAWEDASTTSSKWHFWLSPLAPRLYNINRLHKL